MPRTKKVSIQTAPAHSTSWACAPRPAAAAADWLGRAAEKGDQLAKFLLFGKECSKLQMKQPPAKKRKISLCQM